MHVKQIRVYQGVGVIFSNLNLHLVGFKLVVYIWDVSLSWWIIILYILLAAKYPTWLHHRCVTFLTFAQPRMFYYIVYKEVFDH